MDSDSTNVNPYEPPKESTESPAAGATTETDYWLWMFVEAGAITGMVWGLVLVALLVLLLIQRQGPFQDVDSPAMGVLRLAFYILFSVSLSVMSWVAIGIVMYVFVKVIYKVARLLGA